MLLAGNAVVPLSLSRCWSYKQQVRLAKVNKDNQSVTELNGVALVLVAPLTWTSVKRSVMLKHIKPNPYFVVALWIRNIWKSPTWAGFSFGLLGYQMLTKPEQELPCSDGYLPFIIFMRFWRLYQLNSGLKWLEYHCILLIWHLMQHLNTFVCKNEESGFAWIKLNHISQARFVHRNLVVVFLSAYIR